MPTTPHLTAPRLTAPAPAAWQRLNPALSGSTLFDLGGDGDLGFAVGNRGTILRTIDGGQTWTARPAPVDALFRAVAVSDDAVWIGGDGVLLHSTDRGETWAAVPVEGAMLTELSATASGAVAATERGTLLVLSEDGITLSLENHNVRAVEVLEGGWLLMTRHSLLWMASDTTLSTAYTARESTTLIDLCVTSTDVDVLVRDYPEQRSTDWYHFRLPDTPAQLWWPDETTRLQADFLQTHVLARGEGWLAIAGDGHASWRSTDAGQTWQRTWNKGDLSSSTSLHTRALWAAPAGLFAAADTALLRSTDGGAVWSVVDARPVDFLWGGDIDEDGGLWMAAPHTVVRSEGWHRIGPMIDSLSGDRVPLGILGGSLDVLLTPGGTVIVSGSRGMWRGSGSSWKHTHDGGRFRELARLGEAILAVGRVAMRSTDDGRSWRQVAGPWEHEVWGIDQDGEVLWGVGDYGFTVNSQDGGKTWQTREPADVEHLSDVAISGEDIIAVGSNGVIVRRAESGWQALTSNTTHTLYAVWHDAATGTTVAVGEAGTALLSTDGQTWKATETGTDQGLWGLLGDDRGRVVAVGTGGIVLELQL